LLVRNVINYDTLHYFAKAVRELVSIISTLEELIGSGSGPIALETRDNHLLFHGIWRRLQRSDARFILATRTPPSHPVHLVEACEIAYGLAASPTRTTTQIREAAISIIRSIGQQLSPYLG
jgi:hypothetical protein